VSGEGTGPTIFLSAGEPSGDVHGARLAAALRRRIPGVRIEGLGGDRLAAEGMHLHAHTSELSVMGFAEVARHLPYFLKLQHGIRSRLDRGGVDLVIPIDYPGFNLRLAGWARRRGIPVLYYIAPQVWAWHRSRVKRMARDTDRVATVLPFEEDFLRRGGVQAEFVGHPLLEREDAPAPLADCALRWGIDPARPILALLPGSREQEVERHLELFSEAAATVVAARPEVQPVIAASDDLPSDLYRGARWPLADDTRALLHHSRAALVKSGTSTLETALAGTPLVVAYRMNPISYRIARRVVRVPHIALANLVAGSRIAPELIQHEAAPETLAAELLPLLEDSQERARQRAAWSQIRATLGETAASERVADMAADLVAKGSG
jgi:lipid-A-disaccharide synthase